MRLGDCANVFALVNTGAFLAFVLANEYGLMGGVAPSFKQEGFCVSFPGTLYSSHLLAFYVDCVCAAALVGLCRKNAGAPFLEPIKDAAGGIFFHGLGHAGISAGYVGAAPVAPPTMRALAFGIVGLWAFFFFLLKSGPGVPAKHAAAHAAIHALFLALAVPPHLNFTYVQTVLIWIVTFYSLRRPHKDRYYDLSSLIITVPVGLVSWVEAISCDSFFKDVGGHVYYDAIIPASMFLYCAVASRAAAPESKKAR
ncbi:hypothetical protein M885DRAFT_627281 [Pelagophyceae sp. CCMP2097]|nr:hypothetical protein M885DRAFT_627281 [Pelagophyceae sp. CCMP2097]